MQVKRIDPKRLRVSDVEMDGRKYDFILDTTTRELTYREAAHLGGKFCPISDDSRYKGSVRKVVRQVVTEMFAFTG